VRRLPAWPQSRTKEVALVTLLFAALLVVCFPEVSSGHEQFLPNGLLSTQSGKPRVDFPYTTPSRGAVADAGAEIWLFGPLVRIVHNAYADGALPLWDPNQALGVPLAAGFSSAPAEPFYAPLFIHPTQRVWTLVILLRILCSGVGCFALVRALGARPPAAAVAGIGYMLSPEIVYWSAPVSANVEALAPWLLLCVLGIARSPTGRRFAALALVTAWACVGGQPQTLVILAWLAAAWGIFWWIREGRRWRVLGELAGAGALGGLIAAPQLLLGAQYVPLAQNAHGDTLGRNRLSLERFKPFLLGDYSHKLQAGIAMGLLVLAVAGLVARRRAGVGGVWFMTGAMAVWAIRALDLPGQQVVGLLPGISSINVVRKGEFVFVLGGAVLAAAGVQALVRRARPAVVGAAAAIALSLVLWGTGAPRRDVAAAFVIAVLLAAAAFVVVRRPVAVPLLAVPLLLQFFFVTPRTYAKPYDQFAPRPFAKYVQDHLRRGQRLIGVGHVMHPQTAAAMRIADPRSAEALYPKRFVRYMNGLVGAKPIGFAGYVAMPQVGSPFLSAVGVRYVLAPAKSGRPPGDFRPVFRDRSDPSTRMTVWENARAYPRAWLARRVDAVGDEDAAYAALHRGSGDLRARSVVENATPGMRAAHGKGSVQLENLAWNHASYLVSAAAPAVLVTSDEYYPGWTAKVDGKSTPIRAANVAMRAIAVPAGTHAVQFSYRPAGWRYGILLTLFALLVVAARLFGPNVAAWRERRSGRTRPGAVRVLR